MHTFIFKRSEQRQAGYPILLTKPQSFMNPCNASMEDLSINIKERSVIVTILARHAEAGIHVACIHSVTSDLFLLSVRKTVKAMRQIAACGLLRI